ncbi:MAG: hypothetical protein H0U74_14535 [Bradymonadaceae bacterium]|nr:hypothetical protein [Lujinxingiaceae bacterium]
MSAENPFDELGLDPRLGPRELTRILQQRAERASGEERTHLQEMWRELTTRESERIRWALLAHPNASNLASDSIDALRQRVPPFVHRQSLPELVVTIEDALVLPRSDRASTTPLAPPDAFETMTMDKTR